jgi:hypothetical protein
MTSQVDMDDLASAKAWDRWKNDFPDSWAAIARWMMRGLLIRFLRKL